jgi:ribosomal silencing factor RsfS
MNQYNIIRKDGDKIISNLDLSKMKSNGDYYVIHAYDSSKVMRAKLNQLDTWLKHTFQYGNEPPKADDNINKAFKIWNSENKKNILDLIDWLKDPKDN